MSLVDTSTQQLLKIKSEREAGVALDGLLTQLGAAFAISFAATLAFSLLRPKNSVVYSRRSKYVEREKRPPKLSSQPFSWIRPVVTVSNTELVNKIGVDAVVFIALTSWCMYFFLILTLIVATVLIPINLTTNKRVNDTVGSKAGFNLSWLSINTADQRFLWVYTVMTWLVSFIFYFGIYKLHTLLVGFRRQYFASKDYLRATHSRTVLLTHVPNSLQDEQALRSRLGKNGVACAGMEVAIARKLGNIPDLIKKHRNLTIKIEKEIAKFFKDPANDPNGRFDPNRRSPARDKIDRLAEQIAQMSNLIEAARQEARHFKPVSVAFVTYPTPEQAHEATLRLRKKSSTPTAQLAPRARDIHWRNALMPRASKRTRGFISMLILTLLFTVSSVVVAAAATLINLSDLAEKFAPLQYIKDHHRYTFAFLSASVAPTLIAIFFFLVPYIIRYIVIYKGAPTEPIIEREVLSKYFVFLYVSNFIFCFINIGFTLYRAIKDREVGELDKLSFDSVLNEISNAVIKTSTFWINYISVKGIGVMVELAQAFALLLIFLRRRLLPLTPRQQKEIARPPQFPESEVYAMHLFLFAVGVTFSVSAPLILPFSFANFALSLLVYKYQLMYVYETRSETGGEVWPTLFRWLVFSVFFFQVIMIGVLNLGQSHAIPFALVPLPVITLIFWRVFLRRFLRHYKYRSSVNVSENMDLASGDAKVDEKGGRHYRFNHHALTGSLTKVIVSRENFEATKQIYHGPVESSRELDQLVHTTKNSSKQSLGGHPSGSAANIHPPLKSDDEYEDSDEETRRIYDDEDSDEESDDRSDRDSVVVAAQPRVGSDQLEMQTIQQTSELPIQVSQHNGSTQRSGNHEIVAKEEDLLQISPYDQSALLPSHQESHDHGHGHDHGHYHD